MSHRRRDCAALLGLGVAAFLFRLAYRIDYDEDIDALRFALAVEDFDVASLRPHAPFYPVYIALAKALALFVHSPREALGLLGALSGSLSVVLCALLAGELVGRRAAWSAGGLAVASPFLWLSSEKCSSDMTGTAFVTAALFLAVKARRSCSDDKARAMRTMALLVLGLGLGVRLSYFPFAIGCLVAISATEGRFRAFFGRLRDLLFGVVLWLVPLVLVAGPRPLVAVTSIQALGHFTRWGGTIVTVSSPTARLHGLGWGIWANLLGGAWPDAPPLRWLGAPILVLLLVLAVRSAARWRTCARRHPELVLSLLLYVAWVAVGQNVAFKPRHVLPLGPVIIVALARGADALAHRTRFALPVVGALAVQWLVDGAGLARAHVAPSPAASVVGFLRGSSERRAVLSRDLERMIATGAPGRRVVFVRDDDELLRAVEVEGSLGVFITSEALSQGLLETLRSRGFAPTVAFARPRSRYVDSLWPELSLFAVEPRGPSP